MGEQPYEPIGNLGVTPLVPPAVAPFPGVNQRQYEIPQFLPVGSAPGDETPLRSPLIKSDLKDKPPSAKEVNPEDMIPKNKSARGSSDDPRAKDNVKIVAEEKKQRIDMDGPTGAKPKSKRSCGQCFCVGFFTCVLITFGLLLTAVVVLGVVGPSMIPSK